MRRMSSIESSRSGSGAKPSMLRSNSYTPASIGPSAATAAQQQQSLIVAVPVSIRGRRLRQILRCLPIDMMEVQLLAREFFSRCDLQEKYMSLDKCVETFALSPSMIQSVYSYIRTNNLVDDVPFNYARKLALLYLQNGQSRTSEMDDHPQKQTRQNELARIYNDSQPTGQDKGLHLHTPRKSMLELPSLYLTFENFVEAAVYLSPRASIQQRIDLAFHVFDSNNTGVIEVEQIRDVMLDSLQANMAADHSVEQMFVNEVDELISDLKQQYGSNGLRKDTFIEFAQNPEFLNCFTVNKHWLRDILGNDKHNTRYARPQDAEMKQFLEVMASTHGLRSEQIIDLQETLRDHLVDTIEDLKTVSQKHFDQMHIQRRVSTAIFKELKRVQSEHNDEFPELNGAGNGSGFWDSLQRMSMAIGNRVSMVGSGPSMAHMNMDQMESPQSSAAATAASHALIDVDYDILQRNNTHLTLFGYVQRRLPSTYAMMRIAWHSLYLLQLSVSLIILQQSADEHSAARSIGIMTGHALYLCLFLMPLSNFYAILTKLFSLTTNSNSAYCVLFVTSKESQRINLCYALVHAFIHCICHLLERNDRVDVSLLSALLMASLGAIWMALSIYVSYHRRRRSRHAFYFNPFTTANVSMRWLFRVTMLVAFVMHCVSAPGNTVALCLLLVSLMPVAVTIVAHVCVFAVCSRSLEVELAKNERPNYVLLSIKNDREKMSKWRCGQYVAVKCPSISSVEYHPFYITSSPDDRWLKLSVLNCGDWTQKLWHLYLSENNELPDLQVAGPFGIGFDANKMNYNFDYLLIIAAGNGSVEIIASLLNFVCSNFLSNDDHPINKIYFYWMVCVDDGCYWFYKLLRTLRNTYMDAFFPCIFVQSSKHDDKNSNAFGLNFFLALRRESVETNLVSQNVRLSAGRISNFRRPVSVFAPNSRASRFHQPNSQNLLGSLNEKMPLADIVDADNQSEDDIPMRSPDFRHAFNQIRDELMQKNADINRISSISASPYRPSARSKLSTPKKNSMHGIVPALMVSANSAESGMTFRRYYVGTFFVGTDILETRLQRLCQQFSDEQVVFEMNSMMIGDNYLPTTAT